LVGKCRPPREQSIPNVPSPKRHPYDQWSPDARALDLVGDKWTLLIVRDLAAGPRRFVELQRVLPGISTEQLRSRLNRMVADGMLTRKRFREVPPRVDYELTERARELMPVLGELARWGYDWAWSPPRGSCARRG
jgi:DNA-binding HxlR family transcriptional regulator